MHKEVTVLGIIVIVLALLLAIQVTHDGSLALNQLINTKPTTFQNTAMSSHDLQCPGGSSNSRDGNTIATSNTIEKKVIMVSSGTFDNISSGSNNNSNSSSIQRNDPSALLDAESAVFNQVFKKTENSIVEITSKVNTVVPDIITNDNPFRGPSTRLGSGFIYGNEGATNGLIITNNHVVQGSQTVDVTFIDGNTFSAKVIGTDPFSDIAVLQMTDDFSNEHLVPIPFGNSSQLQVGQQVIAIGNPFGLSHTMTNGIVSQVGRLLPNQEMGSSISNAIQTNAAINPGNSGGPLLDIHGNMIGVNSLIRSKTGEFSGIGFAIPSNTVARIVPHLIKDGKYDHPWLGISGVNLTPDLSQHLGMSRDSKGVVIASVTPGSPADKAGIIGRIQNDGTPFGDIITAVDGHQVKRIEDIISYIEECKSVGDKVTITVNRSGQSHDIAVPLRARPIQMVQ